jgi:ABC-type Fe3+-hydroxamate transport system substrate-binding protein
MIAGGDLIDAAGNVHQPAVAGARIVSLIPSVTELLFDLGLGDHVVGRTAFCVHPVDRIKQVRSIGGTKQVNFEKFDAVAPTHVIVNIDETPKSLAEEIAARDCIVVVTHPVEVDDNLALYRLIGAVFDRQDAATELCGRIEAAMADLRDAAKALPERRVLYLIWKDPWMTVSSDTYISRMLDRVHWRTIGGDGGVRYPEIDPGGEVAAAADLILFASEPFPFEERHFAEFRDFYQGDARFAAIDGEMVSWYGSRAIAGLAYLKDFAITWR